MARVTVEDCIDKIPNRFELVMTAAQRARQIAAGAPLTVERDNDKNPVISLREIADETIDTAAIDESLIQSLQKHVDFDDPKRMTTYRNSMRPSSWWPASMLNLPNNRTTSTSRMRPSWQKQRRSMRRKPTPTTRVIEPI